jgi:hypothetical protein
MIRENKNQKDKESVVIYKDKSRDIVLHLDKNKDTIWASQAEIAELFNVNRQAITKHLKNIFTEKELNQDSVSSILEHTASDGKKYKTIFYNLDCVIAVGL